MTDPTSELEQAAADWLDARASGDRRAWRTASAKLDAALAAEPATLQAEGNPTP